MNKFYLNTYEPGDKIGEGGICEVWKIRHRNANKVFALKKAKLLSSENTAAILNEFRFLKFHHHPGIVAAHRFFNDQEGCGIILDYLPGQSLASRKGRLNKGSLLQVILRIIEAANYVSHCGYIYNDYKLQNFILDRNGYPVLIDFNLIRRLDDNSNLKSGTLGYLAPEVLAGNPASVKSDIYSLGVALYELAVGRMPYGAADEGALIRLVTESSPEPPATGISELDETIMRMMERNTEARYGNYHDIAANLGKAEEFQRLVGNNAHYYLESGNWPQSAEILNNILSSENSLSVVYSASRYESDKLFADVRALAELVPVSVHVYSPERETGMAPAVPANNANIDDRGRPGYAHRKLENTIHLIDCGNTFSEDVLSLTKSILENPGTAAKAAVFVTRHAMPVSIEHNNLYSMDEALDGNRYYIDHYLKRHSISQALKDYISELAAGDPGFISRYLVYLIENNFIVYGRNGWEDVRKIDKSSIAELDLSLQDDIDGLPEKAVGLYHWLSALDIAQPLSTLTELTGMESGEVRANLGILIERDLVRGKKDEYDIWGKYRKLSAYHRIDKKTRRLLHRQAYEYYKRSDQDCIDQLAYHSYRAGLPEQALDETCRAAETYFKKYDYRKAGHYIETAEIILKESGLSPSDRRILVKLHILAGDIRKALAEFSRAEADYLNAVALAESCDDEKLLATAFKDLGDLYRLRQKSDESIEYSLKALAIYGRHKDLSSQAACLNNLGLAHWTAGKYDLALGYFHDSLEVNIKLGDLNEQSKIYNNIAIINDIGGKKDEAIEGFEKALECAVAVGNLQLEAKYLGNIGYFYLGLGKARDALDFLQRSYNLAMKIGHDDGQLNAVSNIAQAYHKLGDFLKSAEANQKTLEIAESLGHGQFRVQAAYLLARDCLALGNYRLCREMLDLSKSACRDLSNTELMNDILLLEADYYLSVNDLEKCSGLFSELAVPGKLTHPQNVQFEYLKLKGLILSGNPGGVSLDSIMAKIAESGLTDLIAASLLQRARQSLDGGEKEAAATLLEKYQSYDITDTLLDYEFRVIMAEYYSGLNAYDKALDMLSSLLAEADSSGCLPAMFKALLIRAVILDKCGKRILLDGTMKHLDKVYERLADSLPDDATRTLYSRQRLAKRYIEFSDKYGSGINDNVRVVPENENRLGG